VFALSPSLLAIGILRYRSTKREMIIQKNIQKPLKWKKLLFKN